MKHIAWVIAVIGYLTSCGGNSRPTSMSERDRLMYDNTLARYTELRKRFDELANAVGTPEYVQLQSDIEALSYSFDPKQMSSEDSALCATLQHNVEALRNGEVEDNKSISETKRNSSSQAGVLVERRDVLLNTVQKHPCYLYRGDKLCISASSDKPFDLRLYNADSKKEIKSWHNTMSDTITINNSAVYLVEVMPKQGNYMDYRIAYKSMESKSHGVHATEEECRKGEFGATASERIDMVKLFDEPYRVGLRGQLKAAFSGNMRALVPVQIPKGCTEIMYNLSVTTNERIPSKTEDFDKRLRTYYRKVKLVGVNVYESESGSDLIDGLLLNTRPVKEEDAFCNMYVFTSRAEAKRFQDGTEGARKFKYDVEHSRVGTHSCNGRMRFAGAKTIYLGFENARMRYDNFITLEVVGVKPIKYYYRTIYTAQK